MYGGQRDRKGVCPESVMSDHLIQFGSDQEASYWILIPQLCVLVPKHACGVFSDGPAIQMARAFFANRTVQGSNSRQIRL